MKMELRKSFQFEAAHLLPLLPKNHKCRRLHGHSFSVEIVVTGECDPKLGWLMALGLVGVCLLRLRWPVKMKLTVIALVAVAGLAVAEQLGGVRRAGDAHAGGSGRRSR